MDGATQSAGSLAGDMPPQYAPGVAGAVKPPPPGTLAAADHAVAAAEAVVAGLAAQADDLEAKIRHNFEEEYEEDEMPTADEVGATIAKLRAGDDTEVKTPAKKLRGQLLARAVEQAAAEADLAAVKERRDAFQAAQGATVAELQVQLAHLQAAVASLITRPRDVDSVYAVAGCRRAQYNGRYVDTGYPVFGKRVHRNEASGLFLYWHPSGSAREANGDRAEWEAHWMIGARKGLEDAAGSNNGSYTCKWEDLERELVNCKGTYDTPVADGYGKSRSGWEEVDADGVSEHSSAIQVVRPNPFTAGGPAVK